MLCSLEVQESNAPSRASNRFTKMPRRVILIIVAIVVVGGGAVAWFVLRKPGLPPGFAGANGRLEAKQVDIATKYQGRIKEVLADEGDNVDAGQVVAKMDRAPIDSACF